MGPISRDHAIAEYWEGIRKSECYRGKSPEFRNKIYELAEFSASKQVPICGTVLLEPRIRDFLLHKVKRVGRFMTLYAVSALLLLCGAVVLLGGAKQRISGQVEVERVDVGQTALDLDLP